MDEEKKQLPELSQYFTDFLLCVNKTGARATIWDEEKKGKSDWNIPIGCIVHNVTDTNLITFRPLSRRERRGFDSKSMSSKIWSAFIAGSLKKLQDKKQAKAK
jgi:hypothetical protein